MKRILGIFLLLPFLTSNGKYEHTVPQRRPSSKEKMEQNPRNRAFVESFQRLHSFGVMERQEEKEQKKSSGSQKASP